MKKITLVSILSIIFAMPAVAETYDEDTLSACEAGIIYTVDDEDVGATFRYKSEDGGQCYDWDSRTEDCDDEMFTDLEDGQWAVELRYGTGTIYGNSKCSATRGAVESVGDPYEEENGFARYCWCQVSGLSGFHGQMGERCEVSMADWVYVGPIGYSDSEKSENKCKEGDCAYTCGRQLYNGIHYSFGETLLGDLLQ